MDILCARYVPPPASGPASHYMLTLRPLALSPPVPRWFPVLADAVQGDVAPGDPIGSVWLCNNDGRTVLIYRPGEGEHTWADFADPHTIPLALTQCTEDDYRDSLECLWPAVWEKPGFLVGEPWTHKGDDPAFRAFFRIEGQHYVGNVPLTAAEFRALSPADLAEAIRLGSAT